MNQQSEIKFKNKVRVQRFTPNPALDLGPSCVLLVSGGQILEGYVELFVERNIPMIPSKVTHCPTQEGINSENRSHHVNPQLPLHDC